MIIGGKRACGKTTELIKVANKKHLYIICADRNRVHFISQLAKQMKLDIPFPISVEELPLRSTHIKEVLVDDMEDVLHQLIRKPVLITSTSLPFEPLATRPTTSQMVINEFARIIDSQDEKGILKYGETIDDAADQDYNWELMALEETADLQKYLVKRIKQLNKQLLVAEGWIKELENQLSVKWISGLDLATKPPYEDLDD
jgi:hypothetical protein